MSSTDQHQTSKEEKIIIIHEKVKILTLQEKIDEIARNINLENIRKNFIQDIHNLNSGNLFFFDSEAIEHVIIDGKVYYSFESYYYDKYYKNFLSESKINLVRDVFLLKKIILHISKKNKNVNSELIFFDVLNKYLKIKIKSCYRIICSMIKRIKEIDTVSELNYVDKYLIYFISQHFVIDEEKK
jgi:hypothetical protein